MRILAPDLAVRDLAHMSGTVGRLVACATIDDVLHAVVEVSELAGAVAAPSLVVTPATSSREVWLARCDRTVSAWYQAADVIVALM